MPTKKCEVCGEEVQNLKYKSHMMAHNVSEPKAEVNVIVKKPVEKPKDKPVTDPEMDALIKSAQAAQEKILEAPDRFFSEDSADKHGVLVKVHCPECLGDNPEWTPVFGDARKRLDGYAAKAYLPVLDEKGLLVRDEDGNPLFKVRTEIYQGRKRVYQKESAARLHGVTQEVNAKNALSGPHMRMTEEALTIEKT